MGKRKPNTTATTTTQNKGAMKLRYLVAIDPDVKKSGVAIWDRYEKNWILHKPIKLGQIPIELSNNNISPENTQVVVEASWFIQKSNYRGGSYRVAQKKANGVGRNQGVGMAIVSLLKALQYEVFEIRPLSKAKGLFKDPQTSKWTETGKAFIIKESGITAPLNDDVRDAIFIALKFR